MVKSRHRTYLATILSVCMLFVCLFCPVVTHATSVALAKDNSSMTLHFIDVGQGDATFIELYDGRTVLIDAGTSEYGERVVKYIKKLGYTKIDCVIATHADSDHVGGLDDVLYAFEVQYIFRPFVIAKHAGPADDLTALGLTENQIVFDNGVEYKEFIEAVYKETYNGNYSVVKTLSNKSLCNVFMGVSSPLYMIEILYPYADESYDEFTTHTGRTSGYLVQKDSLDSNDVSAVINIQSEHNKILLMADAGEKIENDLIDKANSNPSLMTRISNVDILKVAHHGSKYSSSVEFLNIVSPEHAVISVGDGNSYGHPNEETILRLNNISANVHRTDIDGNIKIEITDVGEVVVSASKDEEIDNQKIIPETIMYIIFASVILAIITISIVYTTKKKNNSLSK